MIRFSLFFTFFITIVQTATAQFEQVTLYTTNDQELQHEIHSTPYKPQLMTLPNNGGAEWLGGDALLGVLGDNTLIYQPNADFVGRDTLKIGYWQWTNFGPQFVQREIFIIVGPGSNVNGKVFFDENRNCNFTDNERRLPNRMVRVFNENISQTVTTNSAGEFAIFLPTGIYQLQYADDNPVWQSCPLPPVVVAENATEIEVDVPLQAVTTQPNLTIDLSTPLLRRCFNNTYTVRYCNRGTTVIENPYAEVVLDPFLVYQNATATLTEQRGDTLRFDLSDLAIDECGDFKIFVKVSCDAELGQTHCTEAQIYPQPLFEIASRLAVTGDCYGDKLIFVIKNMGDADMMDAVEYFVIEDQVVYLKEEIILAAGDSVIVSRPANGKTVRLEVEQTADYTYENWTSKTVEGCTADGTEEVSFGRVNQFAQPDNAPFKAIDCRENIGSYDPNDKQAFPTGVTIGNHNYIRKNTDLEYLIRFQNTGTDTAFTVVIKDALSQNLAMQTLQIGAASHDFTWQLLPDRTLQFTFDHILLPDSTTNEEASHGFVQFRIAQQIDLPVNSEIHNRAAIFFDFNEPIITNEVSHTIGEKFLLTDRPVSPDLPISLEVVTISPLITVFPNPATEKVYFQLPAELRKPANLLIFNQQMQQMERYGIIENLIEIDINKWESGLYFWLIDDGEQRWDGRLIVEE